MEFRTGTGRELHVVGDRLGDQELQPDRGDRGAVRGRRAGGQVTNEPAPPIGRSALPVRTRVTCVVPSDPASTSRISVTASVFGDTATMIHTSVRTDSFFPDTWLFWTGCPGPKAV